MQTNDRQISELMKSIESGNAQLPDFQRGWVWDDNRIKALIASITSNFPVGAAMFLEYGNANIRFKYRVIEGSPSKDVTPSELILDGQQRLTSIYSSLYNLNPVHTRTDKGKDICNKILPIIFEVWNITTKGLEENEIEQFINTLQKIEQNLRDNTFLQI